MGIEFRSEYLALSQTGCVYCCGLGQMRNNPEKTCECVWRSIARSVLRKFKECATGDSLHPVELDSVRQPGRRAVGFVRKKQNYCADVYLTAKRHLSAREWDIFRFFHLQGAGWKLCGHRLGMDKVTVFRNVYRIEEKMGRVWATLAPYSLYPCVEYFSNTDSRVDVSPFPVPDAPYPNGQPLRPPIAPRPPRVQVPRAPYVLTKPAPPPASAVIILDTTDESAVFRQVRNWYSAGASPDIIAKELNRLEVPIKGAGSNWPERSVQRVLIRTPRERAPRKQAA